MPTGVMAAGTDVSVFGLAPNSFSDLLIPVLFRHHHGARRVHAGGRVDLLSVLGSVTAGQQGGGIGDILGGLLGGKPGSASAPTVGANPNSSVKDLLPGGLGELLGGAAGGTALSGGLGALIKEFQERGQGQAAQSWVVTGPNQKIGSNDLARALGTDTIAALSKQTGVGREDLLAGLSQHLPDLVDQLSPNGRLPTAEEASRMV